MYSLLVCQDASKKHEGAFVIPRSRFLEYTIDSISSQLKTFSTEARASIQSWPCILMQEGRGQEEAQIVEITHLDETGAELKITVRSLPNQAVIPNDAIWKMRDALDIGEFEFSRNHFAVKDRDLFSTLIAEGCSFERSVASHFNQKPLPSPQRFMLIRAGKEVSNWSHSDIDSFLLEAGMSHLAAGRELGSRRDRANAIVEFALRNPDATTAENALFSVFFVNRALSAHDGITKSEDKSGEVEVTTDRLREVPSATLAEQAASRSPNRVFLVHGQNELARAQVVSFLESIGLHGIVLHEQPNMGRHLLTKFIEEAELVTFAIVLMTDDDVGGLKGYPLAPRARQNVILELGYFLSHLGQPRVCALITPGLETPSDFDGIVYIRMDEEGRWKAELRRELLAARMPVTDKKDQQEPLTLQ